MKLEGFEPLEREPYGPGELEETVEGELSGQGEEHARQEEPVGRESDGLGEPGEPLVG